MSDDKQQPSGKLHPSTAECTSDERDDYYSSLLEDALHELVTLKTLKDSLDAIEPASALGDVLYQQRLADYQRRKPLAWQRARDLLEGRIAHSSTPTSTAAAESERRLPGERLTDVISWAETEVESRKQNPDAYNSEKAMYLWFYAAAVLDLRDDVLEALRGRTVVPSSTAVAPIVELRDVVLGEGYPGWMVWLRIGNQQFSIGDAHEEKDGAEWSADMLRKALTRVVPSARECSADDARDAARYRHLREQDDFAYWLLEELQRCGYHELSMWQDHLDQAIDNDIKARASDRGVQSK